MYSAFDRELLAAYLAVRHFYFLLEAKEFHILTDHKTLTYALHRVSEPWSARQQQLLSYVAEFTADICHVAGKDNVVANALLRPPPVLLASFPSSSSGGRPITGGNVPLSTPHHQTETSSPSAGLDFLRLAQAQQASPELLEATAVSSLHVTPFKVQGRHFTVHLSWCSEAAGAREE